jgi:hypothetical protein
MNILIQLGLDENKKSSLNFHQNMSRNDTKKPFEFVLTQKRCFLKKRKGLKKHLFAKMWNTI